MRYEMISSKDEEEHEAVLGFKGWRLEIRTDDQQDSHKRESEATLVEDDVSLTFCLFMSLMMQNKYELNV